MLPGGLIYFTTLVHVVAGDLLIPFAGRHRTLSRDILPDVAPSVTQQHVLGGGVVAESGMPAGDPAGHPNAFTRLEVTSKPDATVPCGRADDGYTAGYAHFTNQLGVEDKHMFWWFFPARHGAEDAPLVLTFGGGPGGSGMLFPFSGAGPCIMTEGDDGEETLEPSPYSWTEHANLLAIDHPVGVGFSYADKGSLRNSSARAAWDVDDFLQAFWKKYPSLVKNQLVLHSGSYGGTFMPNVVSTIRSRNLAAAADNLSRFYKMPESLMLVNPMSDWSTHIRWFLETTCFDLGLFNRTVCEEMLVHRLPACLDAIALAYTQHSPATSEQASGDCAPFLEFEGRLNKSIYDTREECGEGLCLPVIGHLARSLNHRLYKEALGVPDGIDFLALSWEVNHLFVQSGDVMQPSPAKLLEPAINEGMRLLVYNGMYDASCHWRGNLAWMRLLNTKHQQEFRNATEVEYSGVGSVLQAGDGAGSFTLLKIREAGHIVILKQPALLQHMSKKWMANEPFF